MRTPFRRQGAVLLEFPAAPPNEFGFSMRCFMPRRLLGINSDCRVTPNLFFYVAVAQCGAFAADEPVMNLTLPRKLFPLLLSAACLLPAPCAHAQSASPAIIMKMSDYMDSVVDQGIAALRALRSQSDMDPAPAAPPVISMKLDKINARFVEKQDQIYDRVHHLTWSRCSVGQHWVKEQGCVGAVRQFTYDQALLRANDAWRIPTTAELATLIDHTKKNMPEALAIDSIAFPGMDLDRLYYWSSDEEDNSFAWAVLFVDTGVPSILYRSHRYALRLVRSGG